jgi:hypothetical protein
MKDVVGGRLRMGLRRRKRSEKKIKGRGTRGGEKRQEARKKDGRKFGDTRPAQVEG